MRPPVKKNRMMRLPAGIVGSIPLHPRKYLCRFPSGMGWVLMYLIATPGAMRGFFRFMMLPRVDST